MNPTDTTYPTNFADLTNIFNTNSQTQRKSGKVILFIIENIEADMINLNHMVKKVIDKVQIVPLEYIKGEKDQCSKQNNPKQVRSLDVAYHLQLAIRKIKKITPMYCLTIQVKKVKSRNLNSKFFSVATRKFQMTSNILSIHRVYINCADEILLKAKYDVVG